MPVKGSQQRPEARFIHDPAQQGSRNVPGMSAKAASSVTHAAEVIWYV